MEFKLGSCGDTWNDCESRPEDSEQVMNEKAEKLRRLKQHISEILLSENLLVLTGLGTSLSAYFVDQVEKLQVPQGMPVPPGVLTPKINPDPNEVPTVKRFPAPTMSDLWAAVKEKDVNIFNSVIAKVKYDIAAFGENIERLLSRCQLFERLSNDVEVATFLKIASKVIVDRCDFVKEGINIQAHEIFLRKVARRSSRLPRTQIFTTNYDLCFESAAQKAKFVIIDGFSPLAPQTFDASYFNYDFVSRDPVGDYTPPDYIPNVFHLHKLHGSIDWSEADKVIYRKGKNEMPCIIYPQDGKYEASYSSPYLELMARFQGALRKKNLGVLVMGFGFNDNHISHPIIQALRSNVHMKMLVVDPSLKVTTNSHLKQMLSLSDGGDWRVGFISETFEEFVKILPDIIKESETEKHFSRITALR